MDKAQSISFWMDERKITQEGLTQAALLEPKVVEAIIQGRYTPSPEQRRRLASALGVEPAAIVWGHTAPVEHIHGHGPQFGRSP